MTEETLKFGEKIEKQKFLILKWDCPFRAERSCKHRRRVANLCKIENCPFRRYGFNRFQAQLNEQLDNKTQTWE